MKISLAKPSLSKEEVKEIEKVFLSGWVAGNGPTGIALSEEMNRKYGFSYSLPVANCTSALHLALVCLGIKKGDDVLVSDFTFPATGHSVLYVGAKPIFVDSHLDSYNFNVDDAAKKITPNTKAIICVHTFGNMCDMTSIKSFAKDHNLLIIEDAACALGSSYGGDYAGSFGDIGCFSMHARKNITCGEGGLITFKTKEMYELAKKLSAFGQQRAFERTSSSELIIPVFEDLGYNYKLSDISCGILLAQLKGYNLKLEKRRELAVYYRRRLKEVPFLKTQVIENIENSVLQAFVCTVEEPYSRNRLIMFLREKGIESQIGTYSSSEQPVYGVKQDCPVSKSLFDNSIALPLHYDLTKRDIDFIIEKIKEFPINV